ncbi:hypothetical protein [Methylophaga sp.]|uniref:hypothetical protein n=1 Tax=Methylophaga sp. TaxID=2024840 RepID=UPI00272A1269|nr:hypothetical protein [Methylophaga sp.]
MTKFRKSYSVFFFIIVALGLLIYLGLKENNSPFRYIETDDFYSYIVLESDSKTNNKMIVPHGVFSVHREGGNLYVARMVVSIIDCPKINGQRNEGSVYRDVMEFWVLNDLTLSVTGPMTRSQYESYLYENDLQIEVPKKPNMYSRYVNDIFTVCN